MRDVSHNRSYGTISSHARFLITATRTRRERPPETPGMDEERFDTLARMVMAAASRRGMLSAGTASVTAGVALAMARHAVAAPARREHKRRPSPRRNAFGCLNVRQKCQGRDRTCCSGRCQGPQPKPGKRDKRRCAGHHESTCTAGQMMVQCGGVTSPPCVTTSGTPGFCGTTTGKAPYCFGDGDCFVCKRDRDCEAVCGAGAACIACPTCTATGGTGCVGLANCVFT